MGNIKIQQCKCFTLTSLKEKNQFTAGKNTAQKCISIEPFMSPLQVLDQIAVPFAWLYRENTAHSFFQVKKAKFVDPTPSFLWISY